MYSYLQWPDFVGGVFQRVTSAKFTLLTFKVTFYQCIQKNTNNFEHFLPQKINQLSLTNLIIAVYIRLGWVRVRLG